MSQTDVNFVFFSPSRQIPLRVGAVLGSFESPAQNKEGSKRCVKRRVLAQISPGEAGRLPRELPAAARSKTAIRAVSQPAAANAQQAWVSDGRFVTGGQDRERLRPAGTFKRPPHEQALLINVANSGPAPRKCWT